jgi:hypothetical protein
MPAFKNLKKGDRIGQSGKKVERLLKDVQKHDLTPLAEFLGMDVHSANLPQPRFSNLSGTKKDFLGSDALLTAGENEWFIQDKFRTSLQGFDLGIEFCRMFLYDDHMIVLDGGRDIYRQFPHPVEFTHEETLGIRRAKRNWPQTRTQCDLFLVHTRNSEDYIWVRAEPAKKIAQRLLKKWINKFPGIEAEVETEVFGKQRTLTYNELLDSDMDIKCLREKHDQKLVKSDKGVQHKCYVAKTIVYIPFSMFTEGTEWVRTTRR